MSTDNRQSGFSLVELSITLVIIGLLLAAITSGAHLMQASKINKIISELAGYAEAVQDFRTKYNTWPGDMPNASSKWSEGNDGDGDELIEGDLTERVRAWEHLTLANMIIGDYTGASAGTPNHKPGANVPPSVIDSAFYFLATSSESYYGVASGSTYLQISQSDGTTSPHSAVMSPADVRVIDKKTDDGDADEGIIFALRGVDNGDNDPAECVTEKWDEATSAYILTDFSDSCRLIYWLEKY